MINESLPSRVFLYNVVNSNLVSTPTPFVADTCPHTIFLLVFPSSLFPFRV